MAFPPHSLGGEATETDLSQLSQDVLSEFEQSGMSWPEFRETIPDSRLPWTHTVMRGGELVDIEMGADERLDPSSAIAPNVAHVATVVRNARQNNIPVESIETYVNRMGMDMSHVDLFNDLIEHEYLAVREQLGGRDSIGPESLAREGQTEIDALRERSSDLQDELNSLELNTSRTVEQNNRMLQISVELSNLSGDIQEREARIESIREANPRPTAARREGETTAQYIRRIAEIRVGLKMNIVENERLREAFQNALKTGITAISREPLHDTYRENLMDYLNSAPAGFELTRPELQRRFGRAIRYYWEKPTSARGGPTIQQVFDRYIRDYGYFPPPELRGRRALNQRGLVPPSRSETHGEDRPFGAAEQGLVWNVNVPTPGGEPGQRGAWIPESQDEAYNRVYATLMANEDLNSRVRVRIEDTLEQLEEQRRSQRETLRYYGGAR
jgi:hypothetical protein